MQRERAELVPIGEVISGLDDVLVPAIRDAPPQARHHFTVADQVNQLVSASEADPDLGFMARLMALCSLPRTNPGNRLQYVRKNGPYKLAMIAGAENKLPYGRLGPLADGVDFDRGVKTQSPVLVLGHSLTEFMKKARHQQRKRGQERRNGRGSATRWIGCSTRPSSLSTSLKRRRRILGRQGYVRFHGGPQDASRMESQEAQRAGPVGEHGRVGPRFFSMTSFAIPCRST